MVDSDLTEEEELDDLFRSAERLRLEVPQLRQRCHEHATGISRERYEELCVAPGSPRRCCATAHPAVRYLFFKSRVHHKSGLDPDEVHRFVAERGEGTSGELVPALLNLLLAEDEELVVGGAPRTCEAPTPAVWRAQAGRGAAGRGGARWLGALRCAWRAEETRPTPRPSPGLPPHR